MAAYPTSLRVCVGSGVKVDSGITVDRASNGAARARRLYAADKRTFSLSHQALDATERGTLNTFYETNKDTTFDFVFDGVTYSCLFANAPQPDYIGAGLANVAVELEEA